MNMYFQWDNPDNGATSKRVSVDDRIKIDMESGTLKIETAELKDSGKYICRAVPKETEATRAKIEPLTAEIHVNIISGKENLNDYIRLLFNGMVIT